MTVESLLLVLVPTLAALGTLILGLGQQQHTMSILVIFVAATSAVFTDWLKWFRLHPILANVAALGAVGYSFLRVTDGVSQSQLFSVANLLVYLQIILLYQQKNIRIYWHICLLSLLQVVVAAALELGPQFGALLLVYLFLTLLTMTLLFIRGESQSRVAAVGRLATGERVQTASDTPPIGGRRLPSPDLSLPSIEFSRQEVSLPSVENSMLNRQLFYRLMLLGVMTLTLTTFAFFLIPRFGEQELRSSNARSERLVGFSPQLNLGEIGRTLQSRDVVMRAQFTKADGQPFNALVDPYFRGNVLSKYVPRQGIWLDAGESYYVRSTPLSSPPPDRVAVKQTIVLETEGPLFSVFPAFAAEQNSNTTLRHDPHRMLLTREDGDRPQNRLIFTVATTTFRNGIQRRSTRAHPSSGRPGRIAPLLEFQPEYFPKLTSLAQQLVDESKVARGDHQAIAKLFESHLKATGKYTYSLEQIARPRGVDPIEHFTAVTRTGHCEYFASALAMMLRSQRIPARVVVGFHGGEFNQMGHFFLVRQLHAHAWVEAFITKQELEEFGHVEDLETAHGAWLRLDPTPGNGNSYANAARGGIRAFFSQFGDFLDVLWRDYVVGLNSTRQREAIYRPIVERTSESLLNPEWWMLFAAELRASMGLDSIASFRKRWVNWKSVPLLAAIFFGGLLARRIWKYCAPVVRQWLAKRFRFRRRSWTRDPQLVWFRRLERYLSRKGIRRLPSQTHREFVMGASRIVAGPAASSEVFRVADRLVDGFYRVRFGGQSLSPAELTQLEKSVRQFETAISQP